MSAAGSAFLISLRTSLITSSMSRVRVVWLLPDKNPSQPGSEDFVFNRTVKSPRLASVTAARPSWSPGRRGGVLNFSVALGIFCMWRRMRADSGRELPGGGEVLVMKAPSYILGGEVV